MFCLLCFQLGKTAAYLPPLLVSNSKSLDVVQFKLTIANQSILRNATLQHD